MNPFLLIEMWHADDVAGFDIIARPFNPHIRGECNRGQLAYNNNKETFNPHIRGECNRLLDLGVLMLDCFQPPHTWGMQQGLCFLIVQLFPLSTPTYVGNATAPQSLWVIAHTLSTPTYVGNATPEMGTLLLRRPPFNPHIRGECNKRIASDRCRA